MSYFTFVRNAAGLNVGDKVKLMGFDAGEILEITPQPPEDIYYDVYIRFQVREPYYGYLWEDSEARVAAADFLGNRSIEVTKGTNGAPTYLFNEFKDLSLSEANALVGRPNVVLGQEFFGATNLLTHVGDPLTLETFRQVQAVGAETIQVVFRGPEKKSPTGIWDDKAGKYQAYHKGIKGYFLLPDESPALTERLEDLLNLVETNLPNVLDLTNKLAAVLTNAAGLASRADALLADAHPVVTNLADITTHLREPKGALGEWLLPTNLNQQLAQTLTSANLTLRSANTAVTNTDERLGLLVTNLDVTLENLAGITSNLHAQVQANSNLVSSLNNAIARSDEFIQGLRRHWLLRSAFKEKKTNPPPRQPLRSPKESVRP